MAAASYDVLIVGAGIAGLTLACALAKRTSLSIALIEAHDFSPPWQSQHYHHRVSAITLASRRIFQALGVWESIELKRISPFTQIKVWHEAGKDTGLTFDSREIHEPCLGYIIENDVMMTALQEKLRFYPQVAMLPQTKLAAFAETDAGVVLTMENGEQMAGRLAVAADGANSWLRSMAAIPLETHDYEQSAIVATVLTAKPHATVARQSFLPTRPLAFLPLAGADQSSIVWSLPTADANRLAGFAEDEFCEILARSFDHRLGAVTHIGKRYVLPLKRQRALAYAQSKIVLVGDAAHVVHPLAGQGVNMGLLDVASLVDVIESALFARRDFASRTVLRRYERWRKADNAALYEGIDFIKSFFAREYAFADASAEWALSYVNNTTWLKKWLTAHAVGNRLNLPKLAQSLTAV